MNFNKIISILLGIMTLASLFMFLYITENPRFKDIIKTLLPVLVSFVLIFSYMSYTFWVWGQRQDKDQQK